MCVMFTAIQYLKLYECGQLYCNEAKLITGAALIKSLNKMEEKWFNKLGFGNTTTNGGIPNHDCQLVK